MIDGVREVRRAVENGFEITELYLCQTGITTGNRDALLDIAARVDAATFLLPSAIFSKISFGNRNEGVVAVASERRRDLSDLQLPSNPFLMVLDGIEKPGNVGAVFRSATAAGVDAILLTNSLCEPFNPNSVRASLGTVFELPFASCDVTQAMDFCERIGVSTVVTRVDGDQLYTDCNYQDPIAIVLGSEAAGVQETWKTCRSVIIPMKKGMDSLNISATAAVLAFEVARQRA
ncbi:MAG: RNA methyltransferase [Pirellulaceae bacterium]|nr:RNA methyltransferase [Pirellulaceae bacterium]